MSHPRVITLIPSPRILNTMNATRSENGIEIRVIRVVRTFARNKVMIIATTIAESRSASSTLVSHQLINHSWRKISPESVTHFGRFGWSSASASSIDLVRARVLASFCLMIRRMTPGFPLIDASHRLFGSGANTTSAISSRVTIRVFPPETVVFIQVRPETGTVLITVFLSSSTSVVRASIRIGDSLFPSIMNHPTLLSLATFIASHTSATDIPNAVSFSGLRST